jgi:hypothetical protein
MGHVIMIVVLRNEKACNSVFLKKTSDGPMMRDDRGEMKDDEGCEER